MNQSVNQLLPIGLGMAAIGRPQYINLRQEKPIDFSPETFKQHGKLVLDEAYKRGVRYFDTAPGYGIAEQILFDWLNKHNYPDIEVASKWGYTYTANFDANTKTHEVKEHSLAKLKEQWHFSKQLLPYLTTYQVHSATIDSGILKNHEILDHLNELKQEHNIKIGITTSGANQLEVIDKALNIERNNQPLFEIYQVTYNILDQSLTNIIRQIRSSNMRVVIKEAMANGRLLPNGDYLHYNNLYGLLTNLATKYNVGLDAIALRFVIDMVKPFSVLSGAAIPDHVKQNLLASEFALEKGEMEKLKNHAIDPEAYWSERKKLEWN